MSDPNVLTLPETLVPAAPQPFSDRRVGVRTGIALLVETLPLYREALTDAILSTLEMSLCGSLTELSGAAGMIRARQPHLVVLDREAPGADLAHVIAAARMARPDCRIAVTTAACSSNNCGDLAAAGMDLCLSKRLPVEILRQLLRRLVHPASAETPAHHGDNGTAKSPSEEAEVRLTASERRVLALIAMGHTVRETAAALGRSPKTIDAHKTRIMGKLGIHDRVVLARYAIRAGIVSAWSQ